MAILQDRIAVVTGASSGIGFAIAQRFVREGAHVYITGRREAELMVAAKALGTRAIPVVGDIARPTETDELFRRVQDDVGRVDVLVANSGVLEPKPLADIKPEDFDRTFDINCKGLFFSVQKAIPLMRQGGSIVLIGSASAIKGVPGYSAYSATKAAARSFARTWAKEFRDRGIRVNCISPGPIDTPLIDNRAPSKEAADQLRSNFASLIPLGRMGRPDEVAAAALFLASKESSFITGIDLPVDGGMAQV